jgi:hypothetical protein
MENELIDRAVTLLRQQPDTMLPIDRLLHLLRADCATPDPGNAAILEATLRRRPDRVLLVPPMLPRWARGGLWDQPHAAAYHEALGATGLAAGVRVTVAGPPPGTGSASIHATMQRLMSSVARLHARRSEDEPPDTDLEQAFDQASALASAAAGLQP